MSKDLWIAEHERACEDLWSGAITEDDFKSRMKELGLDRQEIEDHLDAYRADMEDEKS